MGPSTLVVLALVLCSVACISATLGDSSRSLVASAGDKDIGYEVINPSVESTVPKIYQMHVRTHIRNRYAHTTVISRVRNVGQKSQEAVFSVVLPENAFISGFIMEVDGKNYTAYVKEKEEAKRIYDKAVRSGLGAAHVAVSVRNSNRFAVSVHIEPETKASFYLRYEELLQRQSGFYELVVNLHPGQLVKDFSAEIIIAESREIRNLRAPPIRSGNEIGNENKELEPKVKWGIVNKTSAVVTFTPNPDRQRQLAHILGTEEGEGFAGQFVVQYDVERDPKGGEVLIQDGYFVHFFAPSELAPLPKHVVFVLDTSGSMWGQKMEQLKEAMYKILEQLHPRDTFNLVEFNSDIKVWDLNNFDASVRFSTNSFGDDNSVYPNPYLANADNIRKAHNVITEFKPSGGTDIHSGLKVGLRLIKLAKIQQRDSINRQPMMIFLTDGEPTSGLTSIERIINDITELNSRPRKSAIFTLSFGEDANKDFLEKLAIQNSGFSRHIYAAADASLQLQNIYRQISSPLLANVTFKYESSVANLTKTEFPVYFGGSELVIAGWFDEQKHGSSVMVVVDALNESGSVSFQPVVEQSFSSTERLWAYLTIKQLLEKGKFSDVEAEKQAAKKRALDLALKYSFVTPVSSLVVIKPNDQATDGELARAQHFPAFNDMTAGSLVHFDFNNIVIMIAIAAKTLYDA